ncbi:MAG: hypothetical protein K2Z81_07590, partial [Cyanobacteria bacterium]|nr:hypothetical protein [Cyanobacteriota bacterium]
METQEQRFQPEQNPPQDGSAGLLADTETGNRRTSEQAPVRQETSPAPTGDAAHGGYSSVEEHTSVILREGIWAPPTGTRQSAPESRTPSAQPEIASTTQPETRPQTPAPQTETETRPAQPAPPAAQPSDARPAQPAQPETRPQTPVAQPENQPETRPAPAQPSDARPAQPAQPETRPQTPVAQPEGPSETRPAQPAPAQPSDARPAQPAQPSEPRPSQPAQAETRPQPPAAQTESAPETRTTQPEQPATQPSEERPAQQPAQPARTGTTPTDQNGTESRTLQTEVASSGHRNEVRTQPDGRFDETLSRIRQRISDRFVNPTEGNLEAPRSSSTSTNQNDGRVNVDRRKDTDRINRNGDDLQLDLVTGRVERRNRDPLPVVEMTNLNTTSSAAQATGRVETSTSQPGNGRQLDGFTSYSTNHQNETRVDSGTTTAIETDRTRDNVIGRVQNTTPTETTYTPSITDRDRPYDDVSSRPASPVPPARQPITEDRNFYRNTPSINSGAESGNEMSLPNRWTPDQPANTQSGRITTGVLSTVEFPTTTRVNPADQQNNTARPDGTASDAPRTATRSMVLSVPAGEPRTRTETSTVNTADDPRILN